MSAVVIGKIVPFTQYVPPKPAKYEAPKITAKSENEIKLLSLGLSMGHEASVNRIRELTGSKAKTQRALKTAWDKYLKARKQN